jgi:hypothetical protein
MSEITAFLPAASYDARRDLLGDAPCRCGKVVFWAWDGDMVSVPLEPGDDGDMVAYEDPNHIPRCRPDDHGQLTLDERLYRRHDPACPAPVAPVIPIQRGQRRNETSRRYA